MSPAGSWPASLRDGPASALLVPVAAAAGVCPPRRDGMPPHITVLYPFLGSRRLHGADAAIREVLSGFCAFEFALTRVGRLPGVLYLAPEPAEPFLALTAACARRWPQHPPYGGAHRTVVAHLTLAEGPEPPGLAERAAALLPIEATAEEVWLMTRRPGRRWRRRATAVLRRPARL